MPNAVRHAERVARAQRARAGRSGRLREASWWPDLADVLDDGRAWHGEPTLLHTQRLDTVQQALQTARVRSVADLGCGDGALVRRLLTDPQIDRIVALDQDIGSLGRLERGVAPAELRSGRLRLAHGSFAAGHDVLTGVEAVAMVETIEHLAPAELSALEHQVFTVMCPALVLITTPNVEYNGLLGMAPGQWREAGHRFEWPRSRFRAWAAGVALRRGYAVHIAGIGPADASVGSPTQWARFERWERLRAAPCAR